MELPVNEILVGDALEVLRTFPAESVNCCISSPPYWSLRDYGVAGQLGLEPTFEEYIDKLCTVYDEVKRVLRKDGTCFVNLGDTYNAGRSGGWAGGKHGISKPENAPNQSGVNVKNIPTKSLCLIPERFAIAMVNRGWILRNVIIWHKPNPMPSSAKDRFTVDFEQVFFFVKNNDILWYFRPDGKVSDRPPAYKDGIEGLDWEWGTRKGKRVKTSLWQGFKYWFEPQYEQCLTECNAERPRMGQGNQTKYKQKRTGRTWAERKAAGEPMRHGLDGAAAYGSGNYASFLGRNKRCVWTIPTHPCPEAHFATFPEKLVGPMIKAGCPEFVCKKCGKAREKIYDIEKSTDSTRAARGIKRQQCGPDGDSQFNSGFEANSKKTFIGYTDCGCGKEFRPGVCLDMFLRYWHCRQGRRPIAA